MENPKFLEQKYNLQNSEEVESAARRAEKRTGELVPQDPAARVQNYLDRFNEILEREDEDKKEHGLNAIKRLLHHKFVIKPEEVPENYFENQRRIAREQGHGDIEITNEMRNQHIEVIIADQKSSLDKWVEYLASPDATYPDWLKYYAIRSVIGMGEFDKEKKQFTKRSRGTTKPFPDLNREALAYVLDVIEKKYSSERFNLETLDKDNREEFEKLLQGENFAKLYAWAIEKVTPESVDQLANTNGEWVKYDKGSDHMPLVESLQGHGTGWCTAGESTAETQLQDGDFYVYYSFDKEGKPTIPRVAIRMQENSIAEVRGIGAEQNLDPYVGDIVQEKLREFPDGAAYEKKTQDMKLLTAIESKIKQEQEPTKDDLAFLYEIDSKIEGFGYEKDPRIKEILTPRNKRADLAGLFNCNENQISLTEKEALSGNIVFHYGDLDLNELTSAEGLTLPKHVGGYLDLIGLTSVEGLTLPEHVEGDLSLDGLASAEGLILPENFWGYLGLNGLTNAEGLTLQKNFGGSLYFDSLTNAEGLALPEHVEGDLSLNGLTNAEGLTLPEHVGGDLYLDNLTSAEGLTLPKHVGRNLSLNELTSIEGLTLPEHVEGYLYLEGLGNAGKNEIRKNRPDIQIL